LLSKSIKITNAHGIHLRPASKMSDCAMAYDSSISFIYANGKEANVKSVISILASGLKMGDTIELRADGPDEEEALKEVSRALIDSMNMDD